MDIRELDRIIAVKPEPQTTPSLAQAITRTKARETVADYHFTPSLRAHFKRIFDCIVHRKGQGFWVQAEYGAGKTHFLGALIDLLIWRDADVWDAVRDAEIKSEYAAALAKVKMFPVAFSLRGMGESNESDSLWGVSLPDNLRDGLTAQETAEAAWLSDDAVGATAQAEHLLEKLVQEGFPIREEKKTRDGKEVAIYAYEISAAQESPVKYFAPLTRLWPIRPLGEGQ